MWDVVDYESIPVGSAAVGLSADKVTPSNSPPPQGAYLTLETDKIRTRFDGTNPSDTEGHILKPDDTMLITGRNSLMKFRAIRVSTDANLRVSYLR